MKIKSKLTILILIALTFNSTIFAQTDRKLEREKPNAQIEKRIALIIGNGAYTKAKPLPNPSNDAADMAATLKTLGFEVLSGVNLDKRAMENLIRDFGNKLANGGVGLFYYAGHGIQVGGENYLVPVDANIPEEDEVSYSAVPVNLVLRKMATAGNTLNIVILDACRNNPFARSWRGFRDNSNADGLAKIAPPTGTLVLYATEPGKVASDGAGRNGLFTESLLKQIKKPNLEYDQMVKALSADVWQKSNKQQLPWKEGNSLSDFYFAKTEIKTTPTKTEPLKDESVTEKDKATVEREAWSYIKNSNDPQDFRDFLKEFPNGTNAANAKIKLEQAVWDLVKDSKDKAKIQAYLNEFQNGANAPLARIKLRQLETVVSNPPTNTTASNTTATRGAVRKTSIGMELVYISPGEFMMGSSDAEIDEALFEAKKSSDKAERGWFANETPKHKVSIKDGFWMGKFEVTQADWQAVMGDNPSKFPECGGNCPVENVSWDDIQVFLKRLNAKDTQFEYRLPTEAEWEYAARGGTTTAFSFGDSLNSSQANFDGNYPYASTKGTYINKTVKVGSYQPNNFGLYDMHGNVWEWVQDIYNSSYQNLPTDGSQNMSVGDSNLHVLRGGAWFFEGNNCRSAYRSRFPRAHRGISFGFRVAARARLSS